MPRFTVARPDPTPPALRLPDVVVPLSYRARLSLDATTLSGTIESIVRAAAATDVIWMHGENLKISRVEATSADGVTTQLEPRVVKRSDPPSQFLALLAPTPLAEGEHTLRITYAAPVVDRGNVDAEIASWYPDGPRAEGVFREVAEGHAYTFTMFEPMAARKAFPCFDEPNRKVPWQLTLDVPAGDLALSNTSVVAETALPGGRRRFEFAPTLPLPSYLIAFAVGPFDLVDAGASVHGVPIRIAVRKGRAADASWAVASTAHVLDLLDIEVGIPMPYPKIDLVEVPTTGKGWGAMENPGLITVREAVLRADGTAGNTRSGYIHTVAHELAHQWFGNYATLAWWDDIWLNESFASWLGPKILVQLETTWSAELAMPSPTPKPPAPPKGWKGWNPGWRPAGAKPPLEKTHDYAGIEPYFGGEAGVTVIEILEALVGESGFRNVLQNYLAAHAHGVVTTSDLARAVGAEAKLSLGPVIDAFLEDANLASVHVSLDCKRGRSPTAIVEQTGTRPVLVPVCIAYGTEKSRADTCIILDTPRQEIPLPACPRWMLPNPRHLPYSGPIDDWDALLQFGWRHLSLSERTNLPASFDDRHRLAVALLLLDSTDPQAVVEAAMHLQRLVRYLPDALQPRFRTRLRRTLAARPRPGQFTDVLGSARGGVSETAGVLAISTLAFDPSVLREARALFPRRGELPMLVADAVTWGTLHTDPVTAGRVLDDRLREGAPIYDDTVAALAESPYIVALIEARKDSAANLRDGDLTTLLTRHCEPSRREATQRLLTAVRPAKASSVLETFDACVKQRATLEPVFRAWIDSKP